MKNTLAITGAKSILVGLYAIWFAWTFFGERCHGFCWDLLVPVVAPGVILLRLLGVWTGFFDVGNAFAVAIAGLLTAALIYLGWALMELIVASITP